MARIPINGQGYEGLSVDVNFQKTVNWYPEADGTGLDNTPLYPTPGLLGFTTVGMGPIRSMLVLDAILYVVSGSVLYSVTSAGAATVLGNLITTSGRVEMAHNGIDILIVDGAQVVMYKTSTSTFYPDLNATAPDVPQAATSCTFLDSRFIVNDPANTNAASSPGAFFISGVYDGLSWNALDYDVAERSWDSIEAVRVVAGQLWLIGTDSSEVWWNSGNADFTFERVPSAVIKFGTTSGATAVEANNTILFISKSDEGQGQVLQSAGYTLTKVSTPAIDESIHNYNLADAFGFVFQWKGHTFCTFTFPSSDKTWVYDLANKVWFQWSTGGDDSKHIGNSYVFYNNTHYVGSSVNGAIYSISDEAYDDAGTAITRTRQTPHLHFNSRTGFISAVELLMETGVATDAYPNPLVKIQWSKDRGHTWSSSQWRSMGKVGEYARDIIYRRVGRCESIIFRIQVTDAVKAVLIGAYMDAETGELNVT